MPSQVDEHVSLFDRFASKSSEFVSRAPFFAFCVFIVILWFPTYPLFSSGDTWQLLINTTTTILTFILVALLQNSQSRQEQALQHKLNAIAKGLSDIMDNEEDKKELLSAVGLEQRESA